MYKLKPISEMDESLEVKWVEGCVEIFAYSRFCFLSGNK